MANRAYLYISDNPEEWDFDIDAYPYYDSRHYFPVIWWLLFNPEDVKLVNCLYNGASWKEIKLVAEKSKALSSLDTRLEKHRDKISQFIDYELIEQFCFNIREWSGNYLLVDLSEIIEEEAEYLLPQITDFLFSIDSNLDLKNIPSDMTGSLYSDRSEVNSIGYTYSKSDVKT